MCQGMSLNTSLLTLPIITSQFFKVLSLSGLCVWKLQTVAQGLRNLTGYAQRHQLIHVIVKPTNIVMLSDSHIRCLQGMRVTFLPPTLDHNRFPLSSNCIKMINTFHLLVTFTQDKCYAIVTRGRTI